MESTLSVREVSKLTGYTKRRIYTLAQEGQIPSTKVDSFYTLPASVVETLQERRKTVKRGPKPTKKI